MNNLVNKTIDLAINKNYLSGVGRDSGWGIAEAVRELVQNALDVDDYEIEYDDETLVITTHGGEIPDSCLALGTSSKVGNDEKIGQYGEGMKLGWLVLCRAGCEVTIANGSVLWKPFIGMSETFGCETLHVSVEENLGGNENDVVITINGISEEIIEQIKEKNLIVAEAIDGYYPESEETEYGNLILDNDYRGKVFVNGLFVQEESSLDYGFDFKSCFVKLDRDRSAINFWELCDLVGDLVVDSERADIIYKCMAKYHLKDEIDSRIDRLSPETKKELNALYANEHKMTIGENEKLYKDDKRVLFVNEDVRKYVKNNLVKTEDDENYVVELKGQNYYIASNKDDTGFGEMLQELNNDKEVEEMLNEMYEEWNRVKNELPTKLKAFNNSDYKKVLAIINKMRHYKMPKFVIELMKKLVLPKMPTSNFYGIFEYINLDDVTFDDYVIDFESTMA